MGEQRIQSPARLHRLVQLLHPLQTILVVSLSWVAGIWAFALLVGGPSLELAEFLLLVAVYGLLSACFVVHRVRGGSLHFFDIPVFVTIVAFLRFGLAPIYSFFDPALNVYTSQGDKHALLQALAYVMLGMAGFWLGCHWLKPSKSVASSLVIEPVSAKSTHAAGSILAWALTFYAASFAAKLYLLREHMFAYTESLAVYYQHLASAQVVGGISQFGTYALVLLAIERYSHPSDRKRVMFFNAIFASECVWGLVSGMKGLVLWNLILVAIISTFVQKKLRLGWILAAVLGLILIYPFSNQYRFLIRTEGMKITSPSDAQKVVSQAFSDTVQTQSGFGGWLDEGTRSALERLDLLHSVSAVIWMGPALANLRTRRHWWLLPFYPFVPRFLWPSKPIENMGLEFNLALGGNDETAAAITYPGDLYLEFGLMGVIVGMICLGLFGQWLTNKVGDPASKGGLFLYAALFANVVGLEDDTFSFWTGIIKWLTILALVVWLVYRPDRARLISYPRQTVATTS